MQPGSVQGLQLVVSDIHAGRADLVARGVEVSEVQEFDWGSFVFFSDPDGNGWACSSCPLATSASYRPARRRASARRNKRQPVA